MDEALRRHGYAVETAAITPSDIDSLRDRLIPLLTGTDRNGEVFWPGRADPLLWREPAFLTARALAGRLLGSQRLRLIFEHSIERAGGETQFTDWHQDAAYARRCLSTRQVHLWIPLHDVDHDRGPMQYVPMPPARRPLPHTPVPGSDRLVLEKIDAQQSRECPVVKGDVVAHLPTTPHAALPNRSSRVRQVYILQFRRGW